MSWKQYSVPVMMLFLGVLAGCGGEAEDRGPRYDPFAERPAQAQAGGEVDGRAVYERNCMVCHQPDGSGVPGMQPPLQHSPSLAHDPEDAIRRVLFGVLRDGKGPKPRPGYANIMPAMHYLSNEEVAAVLNYSRTRFASAEATITPEQVAAIRNE
jgi:mono/diheme cytochrome c family protein